MENEQKRFVVGDIHGNFKGLKQVLERSGFDYDKDVLISLGDIADGFSETAECIEEVMRIKNFIWCLGNHDKWCQDWMTGKTDMKYVGPDGKYTASSDRIHPDADMWLSQGGRATYRSYMKHADWLARHREFWTNKPQLYHVIDEVTKLCFVHAGFIKAEPIASLAKRSPYFLYWDRNFWYDADQSVFTGFVDGFHHVYIGHTATTFWNKTEPMTRGIITNMDTGGGWAGKISMMNIDTKEVFQSDLTKELYPDEVDRLRT